MRDSVVKEDAERLAPLPRQSAGSRKKKVPEKIILGIDPGTTVMGYGIIRQEGNKVDLVVMGELVLNRYEDHYVRIKKIFDRTLALIDEYHPDELAIESPFQGKNVQSMLKLGRAQGAAIAAALSRSMPIFEYAPRKIKMSITGRGAASKEQVAGVLKQLLHFQEIPKNLDATDGLAAAVCHAFQRSVATMQQVTPQTQTGLPSAKRGAVSKGTAGSWSSFVKQNPGRIKP